ncbi:MAG: HD domain-containing protein [Myxococcales bacterium]
MNPTPAAGGTAGSARLFDDVVRALSLALDFDEGVKLFHAWRVALLAVRLGRELSLPGIDGLFYAGLLHDVGGIGQPDHVLHSARKGFATARSREHAAEGARILRPLTVLAPIAPVVADHHERFDGTGFPSRKSGDAVPREAYVIHAADALEVALRGGEIGSRLQVAAHTLEALRGAAWPADVTDAALSVIARDGAWLAGLYDDARLQQEMASSQFSPPGLEHHSKAEILSQLLWVFARAIDAKHPVTVGHSHRVTRLARAVARGLGKGALDDWDIVCAGLLHDVGMLGVPRAVVDRQVPLTAAEILQVRRHPLDGEAIVASIGELRALARPAASHHERYDGSGYPWGLGGDQIPLLGQVLAFADCYDGMRAERPHRPAISHDEAIAHLRTLSGSAFDPHLAGAAIDALDSAGLAWPWSDDLDDYRRLLDDDAADPTRVMPLEGKVRVMGPHGPRGAVLMEIAPWVEARIGPDLELLSGRHALSALFGFDPGPQLSPALDADGAKRISDWLNRPMLADEPPLSTVVFTRSGRPLEAVGLRGEAEARLLLRSAEDRLQTMKQLALFYRNFLAGAEAAFFTGRDGRVVEANRTFLDLYGWTMTELIGKPPPVFGDAPERPFSQLCGLAEASAGAAFHGEVETFRKGGGSIPALFTVVAVRDAAGAPLGYVGRAVDISERKRLEAELARKNEEPRGAQPPQERPDRHHHPRPQVAARGDDGLRRPRQAAPGGGPGRLGPGARRPHDLARRPDAPARPRHPLAAQDRVGHLQARPPAHPRRRPPAALRRGPRHPGAGEAGAAAGGRRWLQGAGAGAARPRPPGPGARQPRRQRAALLARGQRGAARCRAHRRHAAADGERSRAGHPRGRAAAHLRPLPPGQALAARGQCALVQRGARPGHRPQHRRAARGPAVGREPRGRRLLVRRRAPGLRAAGGLAAPRRAHHRCRRRPGLPDRALALAAHGRPARSRSLRGRGQGPRVPAGRGLRLRQRAGTGDARLPRHARRPRRPAPAPGGGDERRLPGERPGGS